MSKAAEFIDPRGSGAPRLDLSQPVFDPKAIARAEHALKSLGASMREWLEADIERLQSARRVAEAADWREEAMHALVVAAHDIRGMGATYGFPLASQLAASLCRLIETDAGKAAARNEPALAIAHVDAIRAAVRDGVSADTHPVGSALLRALEARVASLGVAPN